MLGLVLTLVLLLAPPVAEERRVDPTRFWTFIVDPMSTPITLAYERADGARYASLGAVVDDAAARGERVLFATNGGMYHPDRTPVGLFTERGRERSPLVRKATGGNFGWKPNGVFVVRKSGRAEVRSTETYAARDAVWATQSGPMLVVDGVMHEGFEAGSRHVNVRNGVGILPDGRVAFVMSKTLVTFHALASHFMALGCRDALYFDGSVSRTYWPDAGLDDRGGDFGVIVAVFAVGK